MITDWLLDVFHGFWTPQTPVSFLAGVGVYHIYCRLKQREDGPDVEEG